MVFLEIFNLLKNIDVKSNDQDCKYHIRKEHRYFALVGLQG